MSSRYSFPLAMLTLLILFPLATVVLNLADPPLRPEVQKILAAPIPESSEAARHAYEFMLGVLDGERENPERRGAEILPRLDEAALNTNQSESPWRVTFSHCRDDDAPKPCWIDQLSPENERAFEDAQAPLDLYLKLMAYGDFVALGRPTAGRIFDPVSMPSPSLHRLFTLKLASWVKSGGEVRAWHLLESSTRFYAAVLKRGDSLLARMIALVELDANANIVAAEMARRPRWKPSPELIAAFDLPDANDILGSALDSEVRVVNQMVESLRRTWRGWFLRPHETMNQYYDLSSQVFYTDCPEATPACVPGLAALHQGGRRYVVNQVGNQILGTVVLEGSTRAKMITRMKKLLDLKAKFRERL